MLKDLENAGFTIIPNFLTTTELDGFLQDFPLARQSDNQNYQISFVSESLKLKLMEKIKPWLDAVCDQTNLVVDTVIPCANYMDSAHVNFCWHQDHESYYVCQQHYNYLNFYIPIIKPDPTRTGMSIIPADAILNYSDAFENSGATKFFPVGGKTEVLNDDTGDNYFLPVNIDELSVSPVLRPGDLLLMRGDVIHKTQDQDTHRVAISIRCTSGGSIIDLTRLLSGPPRKQEMLGKNPTAYNRILEIFKTHGSDQITTTEFYRLKGLLFFNKDCTNESR